MPRKATEKVGADIKPALKRGKTEKKLPAVHPPPKKTRMPRGYNPSDDIKKEYNPPAKRYGKRTSGSGSEPASKKAKTIERMMSCILCTGKWGKKLSGYDEVKFHISACLFRIGSYTKFLPPKQGDVIKIEEYGKQFRYRCQVENCERSAAIESLRCMRDQVMASWRDGPRRRTETAPRSCMRLSRPGERRRDRLFLRSQVTRLRRCTLASSAMGKVRAGKKRGPSALLQTRSVPLDTTTVAVSLILEMESI